MAVEKQIFTLRQVILSIKKTIEEKYTGAYWVKAEMHKLNRFPSGHCFPELLEKSEGKVVAEIRGTIWSHNFEKINRNFIQVVNEPLKDDSTLLMLVRVSFHETYGLSLQILDIDPSFTLGELEREKRETLALLEKEGILNRNQMLKFPLFPKRIAIISGDASKGYSDFVKVLNNNSEGYSFFGMLFQAYLQGEQATGSIISALRKIELVKQHFDVVVIVRGGGGEVGLSCFNNYSLCKEIATFPLPVLTGIGHSTNFTVTEMIAYKSAITPTELAGYFVETFGNLENNLDSNLEQLYSHTSNLFTYENHIQERLAKDFRFLVMQRLNEVNKIVLKQAQSVTTNVKLHLARLDHSFIQISKQLTNSSQHYLRISEEELMKNHSSIKETVDSLVLESENQLNNLEKIVRLVDPMNVLKRGYTITTVNGTLLDKTCLKEGDKIITRSQKSVIESRVEKINHNE